MICDLKQPGTTGALDDKNLTKSEYCNQMMALMEAMQDVDHTFKLKPNGEAANCNGIKEMFLASISPLLAETIRQLTNSEVALNNRRLSTGEFWKQIACLAKLVQAESLNKRLVYS